MQRNDHHFTYAVARAIGAAALAATIALVSGPVFAAKASAEDRVEARITDMHAKLKITQAQEDQWAKVAQSMRDNEKAIEPLNGFLVVAHRLGDNEKAIEPLIKARKDNA